MPTVLITGGHGGVGFTCSKYLAATYGTNLILAGRSRKRIEPAAEEPIRRFGIKVHIFYLDTSSLNSVRAAAARCQSMLDDGQIDALQSIVCNAGIRLNGPSVYSVDWCGTSRARHTCASRLLGSVADLKIVKEWLGRGSIAATNRYAHLQTKKLSWGKNVHRLRLETRIEN